VDAELDRWLVLSWRHSTPEFEEIMRGQAVHEGVWIESAGGVLDGDLRIPERATGLVIFAHGSGSASRGSADEAQGRRNRGRPDARTRDRRWQRERTRIRIRVPMPPALLDAMVRRALRPAGSKINPYRS
jgi:hypothetical protein